MIEKRSFTLLFVFKVILLAFLVIGVRPIEASSDNPVLILVEQDQNDVSISLHTSEAIAALAFDLEIGSLDPTITCVPNDSFTNCEFIQDGILRVNRVSYLNPIVGTAQIISLNIDPSQSSNFIFTEVEMYTNDLEAVDAVLQSGVPTSVTMKWNSTENSSVLGISLIMLALISLTLLTTRFKKGLMLLTIVAFCSMYLIVNPILTNAQLNLVSMGDVDCDGSVTVVDMLLIDQYTSNAITGEYLSCPDSLNNLGEPNTMFLPACDVNLSSTSSGTDCTQGDLAQIADCDVAINNLYCSQTNQYSVAVNVDEQSSSPNEVGVVGTVSVQDNGGNVVHEHGYVLSTQLWGLTIPVCWIDPLPEHINERAWSREAVVNSWEANSDVLFTGWGTCPTANDGQTVRIGILDSEEDGVFTRGLGKEIGLADEGMVLNFTFNNWSEDCASPEWYRQSCIEAIAVHEFGHVLGFAHEQNRPDTPSWCDREQGGDGDVLIGDWDLHSVMNYCNPEWNGAGELSNGDISTVQAFYSVTSSFYNVFDNLENITNSYGASNSIFAQENHKVYIGDVNGDGNSDLLLQQNFANSSYDTFLLLGKSDGGFETIQDITTANGMRRDIWALYYHNIFLRDFNSDGADDVFIQAIDLEHRTYILIADGNGGFNNVEEITDQYGMVAESWASDSHLAHFGDFDGNGADDIILQQISQAGHRTWLLLADGNGGFLTRQNITNAFGTTADNWFAGNHILHTGDFNCDGNDDVLLQQARADSNLNTFLLVADGNGGFQNKQNITSSFNTNRDNWSAQYHLLRKGDFNGDQCTDVLLQQLESSNEFATYLLLGDSSDEFQNKRNVTWRYGAYPSLWALQDHVMLLGDYNGDGMDDMVFQPTSENSNYNTLLLLARGDGHFHTRYYMTNEFGATLENWATTQHVGHVGDFNGDGSSDIFLQQRLGTGYRSFLLRGRPHH